MKAIELRSLLDGSNKEIEISSDLRAIYKIWRDKRNSDNISEEEIFYAGYILSNPILREQYKKSVAPLREI